jgi:hypothetical protein
MKKRLFALTCIWLAIVLLAVTPAQAGEYHYGATLYCQQCHVMHYSQQHDYSGNPSANPDGIGDGLLYNPPQATLGNGPTPSLLRNQAADLCLSCHNGQTFAPDVSGENHNANPVHPRQAGGLTDSTSPGYDDWNGHTLDSAVHDSPGMPSSCGACHHPGESKEKAKLKCSYCHNPHGTVAYRNLSAVDGISYAKLPEYTSEDVLLRSWSLGDIDVNYSVGNVDFGEPTSSQSAMGKFCARCHGQFHGSSSEAHMRDTTAPAGTNWFRHPTADANIGGVDDSTHSSLSTFEGHTSRVKVMDPGGDWLNPSGDETPTCITCHKAHGNKNPFGLIYLTGSGSITEEGDGSDVRDLCKQCHVQGD